MNGQPLRRTSIMMGQSGEVSQPSQPMIPRRISVGAGGSSLFMPASSSTASGNGNAILPPIQNDRRLSFKRGGATGLKPLGRQVANAVSNQQQMMGDPTLLGEGNTHLYGVGSGVHRTSITGGLAPGGIQAVPPQSHQPVTMTTAIGSSGLSLTSKKLSGPAAVISQQQRELQQRDLFRMRYMRFKCKDIEQTITFYTSFGMKLEFDTDQELIEAPPGQTQMLEKAIASAGGQLPEIKTGPNNGVAKSQQGPLNAKNGTVPVVLVKNQGKKPLIATTGKTGTVIANTTAVSAANTNKGAPDPTSNNPPGAAPNNVHANSAYNDMNQGNKGLGSSVNRVIGFSFADSAIEPPSERIMLMFEEMPEVEEDREVETSHDEADPSHKHHPDTVAGNTTGSTNAAQGNGLANVTQIALAQFASLSQKAGRGLRGGLVGSRIDVNGSNKFKKSENPGPNSTSTGNGAPIPITKENASQQQSSSASPKHNYEYLVIYVHFIQRLAKRLQSKGFIVGDILDIDGIKMFTCKDPNGIEIRMIELSEGQLNEERSKKNQWFARLGYYVIPTMYADEATIMYEQLFQIRPPKSSNGSGAETSGPTGGRGRSESISMRSSLTTTTPLQQVDPITGRFIEQASDAITLKNIRKAGAQAIIRQAVTKGQGFRIVDMDDFVVGLNHTVFYWLGNDLRSSAATVCFTQVSNADTNHAQTCWDPSTSPLLGIGFEVANLETVVYRLRFETKDELEWEQARLRMIKVGLVGRFKDAWHGYWLEVFCSKAAEAQGPRIRRNGKKGANANKQQRDLHDSDSEEDRESLYDGKSRSNSRENLRGSVSARNKIGTTLLKGDGESTSKSLLFLTSSSLKLNDDIISSSAAKINTRRSTHTLSQSRLKLGAGSKANLTSQSKIANGHQSTANVEEKTSRITKPRQKYEWLIDQHHLKGHARCLSAGAAIRRRIRRLADHRQLHPGTGYISSSDEEDSNQKQTPEEEAKLREKQLQTLRHAAVYGSRSVSTQLLTGSGEVLKSGTIKEKSENRQEMITSKKNLHSRPQKSEDERIRDLLATRQKSASLTW